MTIHILKLCVGADSIDDLTHWHTHQRKERARLGLDPRPVCDTRNTPKRRADVLDGGSLYWVIKGVVLVRQAIVDVVTIEDGSLGNRCELVLGTDYMRTAPQRRKAFQGWRYLEPADAPADLAAVGAGGADLPDDLRRQLIELGAW
jgi:hypothetical protein